MEKKTKMIDTDLEKLTKYVENLSKTVEQLTEQHNLLVEKNKGVGWVMSKIRYMHKKVFTVSRASRRSIQIQAKLTQRRPNP